MKTGVLFTTGLSKPCYGHYEVHRSCTSIDVNFGHVASFPLEALLKWPFAVGSGWYKEYHPSYVGISWIEFLTALSRLSSSVGYHCQKTFPSIIVTFVFNVVEGMNFFFNVCILQASWRILGTWFSVLLAYQRKTSKWSKIRQLAPTLSTLFKIQIITTDNTSPNCTWQNLELWSLMVMWFQWMQNGWVNF